jgi:L-arabinose isomerase
MTTMEQYEALRGTGSPDVYSRETLKTVAHSQTMVQAPGRSPIMLVKIVIKTVLTDPVAAYRLQSLVQCFSVIGRKAAFLQHLPGRSKGKILAWTVHHTSANSFIHFAFKL